MSRPIRARIDFAALRHNLKRVRDFAPNSQVMAVIKADGYGHGMLRVAIALVDADAFGVAGMEEAIVLLEGGVEKEICLLTGFHERADLQLMARHAIGAVIHNETQLDLLERHGLDESVVLWLKLDTGMHRVGFPPEQLSQVLARINALPFVAECRLMSHLANADDRNDATTDQQLRSFNKACNDHGLARSVANSAGVVAWPASHFEWVRPGIMLYGSSPVMSENAANLDLKPVMRLQSELIAVKQLQRGDRIGYGGIYTCAEDMPVGVVACGYGDGYPRHAPQATPVWVAGHQVPLVGRVSMDLLTVDLRDYPAAQVGDPVELWGVHIPVDEVAQRAGTIAYELLCSVSARVRRVEGSQ